MKRFRGGKSDILIWSIYLHKGGSKWQSTDASWGLRECPEVLRLRQGDDGQLGPLVVLARWSAAGWCWRGAAGSSGGVCPKALKHWAWGWREKAGNYWGWEGGGGCSSGAELGQRDWDLDVGPQACETQVYTGVVCGASPVKRGQRWWAFKGGGGFWWLNSKCVCIAAYCLPSHCLDHW